MYLLARVMFFTVLPILWFYFVPPLVTFITNLLTTQVPYGDLVLLVLVAPFVYFESNSHLSGDESLQHFVNGISVALGFYAFFYGLGCLDEGEILGLNFIDIIPRVGWWAVMSFVMFVLPNIITSAMMAAFYQLGILGQRPDFVFMLLTLLFYRLIFPFCDYYLNRLIDGLYQQSFDGEEWGS